MSRSRSPRRRSGSPRARKSSPRRTKVSSRSARSPNRAKPASSRLSKADRTRNRSNSSDRSPSLLRRKKIRKRASSRSSSSSPVRRSRIVSRNSSSTKYGDKIKSKFRRASSSESPVVFRSRSLNKKKKSQQSASDASSSSDCSDSNCSMCKFEKKHSKTRKKGKHVHEKPTKRISPSTEPKVKPRSELPRPPTMLRYARSRSLSDTQADSSVEEIRPEESQKRRSKKDKKKKLKPSKVITAEIIHNIKVEPSSDEESDSPSPKRISLSERFGKMAKWNQMKDTESSERNIRVTSGDQYRVEELDIPLMRPCPEQPPPPLLTDGAWGDVRFRFAYYKNQGYLEDLSFQDYLKWEEWWYSYQEWMDNESSRLYPLRRRL